MEVLLWKLSLFRKTFVSSEKWFEFLQTYLTLTDLFLFVLLFDMSFILRIEGEPDIVCTDQSQPTTTQYHSSSAQPATAVYYGAQSAAVASNSSSQPIDETWSISKVARDAPPSGWKLFFADPDVRRTIDHVSNLIHRDTYGDSAVPRFMVVPSKQNIFRAMELTPLSNVKVVIWGQDPYHQIINGKPRAQGVSFSVSKDDQIPVSLSNIYKELALEYPGSFMMPSHGDLTKWAQQGVLLMNFSLTCRANDANSHGKYGVWTPFIVQVLKALAGNGKSIMHVLWGKEAQKIGSLLPKNHVSIEAPHPSGFSAHRGFFGCNHFLKINEHLKAKGESLIDWQIV